MLKNRILTMITVCLCSVLLLTGCGNNSSVSDKEEKISIVCTTFPQYDWVREIIGDNAEKFDVTLLLDNGVDLHSYQPTVDDITKISAADIFIYVGGESDEWAEDAIKEAANNEMQVINLMDILGEQVKTEEIVEGMESEHEKEDETEHDGEHAGEEGHDHEEEEYDEHIWLSLKNAKVCVNAIGEAIKSTDQEHAAEYDANASAYIGELEALDKQYEEMVTSAKFDTVLFGDRFPFRYLVDDYGLKYYAAFVGCSAETEASFETITFLAGKTDELGLGNILVIESSNHQIAETIRQNTVTKDQNILELNSIQSVTDHELENGFTYLKAMQENLEVLRQALN